MDAYLKLAAESDPDHEAFWGDLIESANVRNAADTESRNADLQGQQPLRRRRSSQGFDSQQRVDSGC